MQNSAGPANLSSKTSNRAFVLACAFLVTFCAAPRNLIFGHLYAEEATSYLRYARIAGFWRAFFAPHQSYYSLFPNVVTLVAARLLPLTFAAHWTALCAVLIHVLVIYLTYVCEAWASTKERWIACAIVFLACGSGSSFTSTINSQFFLAIGVSTLLISNAEKHKIFRFLSLLLAGLTGVVSCFLFPLFIYRALVTGNKWVRVQAVMITACTLIQLTAVRQSIAFSNRKTFNPHYIPAYIDTLFAHWIALAYGTRIAYHFWVNRLLNGSHAFWAVGTCCAVFGLVLLLSAIWFGSSRTHFLLVAAGVHGGLSLFGMLGRPSEIVNSGDRYFIVSNTLIAFSLLLLWREQPVASTRRRIAAMLLGMYIVSGAFDLARFWRRNQEMPSWHAQMLQWKSSPETPLRVGPKEWENEVFYLPEHASSLDIPPYAYDSDLRPEVRANLPATWFGPHPKGHSGPNGF